jgi:mono/diheme cytochrome c family protein
MTTLQTKLRNLITISLLTLFAVASAHGQGTSVVRANVPFAFEVHGTSLPAGSYQFRIRLDDRSLVISGAKTGDVRIQILTQLGGSAIFRDTGLVFDTFEGKHVLSELWIPGQDGLLLSTTSKQHTHELVIAMSGGAGPNRSGKDVFERTCARCHGPNGEGNPAADKFFKTSLPKLNSAYVQSKSDAELTDIVSHGRRMMDPVRTGQASVQHLLDPGSVDAVISYLRTLKQP